MSKTNANSVALITGASRGIGAAIAVALARDGMDIGINYRTNRSAAEQVVDQVQQYGRRAVLLEADVASQDAVRDMFLILREEFGRLDVLVNNAAVARRLSFLSMQEDDWSLVLETNLHGVRYCIREAMSLMNHGSKIINMGSVLGEAGLPERANYCASKAAIIGLTRSLAKELAPLSITVNVVSPGWVETDMTSYVPLETREKILRQIPLGRFAEPQEIAEVVSFLASSKCSYMTGAVINVDGGRADYFLPNVEG